MTVIALEGTRTSRGRGTWIGVSSVVTGVVILLARPAIASTLSWTVPVVAGVFATILVLGLAPPLKGDGISRSSATWQAWIFGAGALVFLAGRFLSAGHSPMRATALFVSLNTLAAVAEEALFRRVAFDAFLPAGPIAAIGGSAFLFGLAHVTVYGWWAFPIDTAAGLVLGWQRWASGSWLVPAATHALADILVVI